MKFKEAKNRLLVTVGFIFIVFTIILISYKIGQIGADKKKYISLQDRSVLKTTDTLLNALSIDISKKTDIILNNKKITKAFHDQDREKLYGLLKEYYKRQVYLNKYLKIMTFRLTDGSTFLRIHKPEMFGDKLNKKRAIILDTNKLQQRHSGFEIGKLKMTYRVVTPIFYEDKHIGLVEVGVEPEYIIDKLSRSFDIQSALLVKKEATSVSMEKLQKEIKIGSFVLARGSKIFYDKAKEISLDKESLNIVKDKEKSCHISSGLDLYDHKKNVAAKLLFAYDITEIEENAIYAILQTAVTASIFMIILFFLINNIYNYFLKNLEIKTKLIEKQRNEISTILDASPNIIIVGDGKEISKANASFLRFFNEYKTLREFKQNHKCVCDFFMKYEEEGYVTSYMIEDEVWADYIVKHPEKDIKAAIKRDDGIHHFSIKAREIYIPSGKFIVSVFIDITKELDHLREIERKNQTIAEQSKMAALGEMLGNIAHQWRQPLSAISVSASSLKLNHELNLFNKEILYDTVDLIIKNTQYLSQTIEDFRNFIRNTNKKEDFNLKETLEHTLSIIKPNLIVNHITVIFEECDDDIQMHGYKNELMQSLLNILNNSKDVLINLDVNKERYIFINCYTKDNNAILSIKDNAGGIPKNIAPKIFEPYFTTKHKSQGTGLGLYMTYNIITKHMQGSIKTENKVFEYNGEIQKGACFYLTLPLKV